MAWKWNHTPPQQFIVCDDPSAKDEPSRPSNVPWFYVFEPCDLDPDGCPAGWIEPVIASEDRRTGRCMMMRDDAQIVNVINKLSDYLEGLK
jgi:hypothetical protein